MAKLSTDQLIDGFKELSLIELSEFVKKFEEVFEVTAAAPMAVAAAPPAGGGGDELADDRDRARGGRYDDARVAAETQTHHKVRPGVVGPAPGSDLVAPGGVVLRTAKAIRLVGRVDGGLGAIGKGDAPLRRLIERASLIGEDIEQPGLSLDHNVAGVGGRRGNDGDAAVATADPGADRLGAGARLAPATAGEDGPGAPVPLGQQLIGPGVGRPVGAAQLVSASHLGSQDLNGRLGLIRTCRELERCRH